MTESITIDANEVLDLILDLAERVHDGHTPANPALRWMGASFDECRATTCQRAREILVALDGDGR